MLLYFLILLGSTTYTNAASVPSSLDILTNPSLSNSSSAPLTSQFNNSEITGDVLSWFCTRATTWSLPKVELDDCFGVLDYFFIETMHEGGRTMKEFLAPGAEKASYYDTEITPRKYTFGTCTLAIVMIQDFPNPASLPGGSKTGPGSDYSTYGNLRKVAENLVDQCVKRRGKVGWQPAGLASGIGVFIWSTGSEEDKLIEADEPRFVSSITEAPGNGSVLSV